MRRYVPVAKLFFIAKTEEKVRVTVARITIKEGMEILNNQMD
ncbi:hypothetical protein [Cronobacter malonaticus]|nr:hypothetical protein [Cronobacter malonaticus]